MQDDYAQEPTSFSQGRMNNASLSSMSSDPGSLLICIKTFTYVYR